MDKKLKEKKLIVNVGEGLLNEFDKHLKESVYFKNRADWIRTKMREWVWQEIQAKEES